MGAMKENQFCRREQEFSFQMFSSLIEQPNKLRRPQQHHGGRHTVFWVGHGPPKNFVGWAIMHLAHPKNAGAN
jgi:hypothetical protein